jgi:hypothetical protein
MEFNREAQGTVAGNGPRLGEVEDHVAGIIGRGLERESVAVPVSLRIGEVESAAAGQAQFERGKRLVAVVAQVIDGIDVDGGLLASEKVDLKFLLLDGVAWAERRGAGNGGKDRRNCEQQERKTRTSDGRHGASDCSQRTGLRQKLCEQKSV